MSTRSCYDTHSYLCHAILKSPGDQIILSTVSPRLDRSVMLPEVGNLGHIYLPVHQAKTPETKTIKERYDTVTKDVETSKLSS